MSSANKQPSGLAVAHCSAISRKERAWRNYKNAECFEADGKANAFSKGFDAGEAITSNKWNNLLGERDHLIAALRSIQSHWRTNVEACADNSHLAALMVQEANNATAYLDRRKHLEGIT